MNDLLPFLLIIPLVGAVVGALLPGARSAKGWAMFISLATFAVALVLAWQFYTQIAPAPGDAPVDQRLAASFPIHFGPANEASALSYQTLGISFNLAMDSISLWLVLLTTLLMPLSLLFSAGSIHTRQREYYAWMQALLLAMLGVFVARDLILFYVFFELTLIPMFFIIGIWGGPEKKYAAAKFFLFTFAGSVFLLAGIIYLGCVANTHGVSFDMGYLIPWAQHHLSTTERWWIALAFLIGFAVKVPLFPIHTWLPLAHTEAPTAGSVILAGVLLKLGTYGLLRLAIPLGFVGADGLTNETLIHWIGVLCVIGVLYGALVAWVQQDIKKLVAYSSVSHLGFCVLGLMALNDIGMQGSVLYMLNHGLSTGAMFLVIGMIYDRYHTRDINQLSGLARVMPIMAFFFIFFTMSSIGLPGTNGFVSEFLSILGAFTSTHLGMAYAVPAALGVILGAVYMLHMAARVIFGPLKTPHIDHHGESQVQALPTDLSMREIFVLVPIAILVIVLGVCPTPLLDSILTPVQLTRETLVERQRTWGYAEVAKPPFNAAHGNQADLIAANLMKH
jgi:NADH-quinone oxidoreductase subunit M